VAEHPKSNRPGTRRVTVSEAAEMLGISTGAIRNRITRGTLEAEREEGRVFVVLPADMPEDTRQGNDMEYLKAHIATLQDALEAERESSRELRRIVAGLVQRVPELEAPTEPQESPETATEQEAEPHPGGAQEGAQRPWWRRVFGG
jgi:hypothetical protein